MKLQDARTIPPEQLYERRKQAVMLRKKKHTYAEIGEIVGVNRNVVSEWIGLWKEGGMKALQVKPAGRPKGKGLTLSKAQQQKIKQSLVEIMPDQLKLPFALWTRAAVQQLIADLFEIKMPIRSVGNYLKRWGFTPQKPIKRAYERNEKKVKEWLEKDYPALATQAKKEGAEIHWGDETGICSSDQVGRGYAPKGKTPVRRHKGKSERVNMISSVTNQGKVRFMFYDGTMNAKRLLSFFRRLIKDTQRKVYMILDNLRVHHAKIVRSWLDKHSNRIEVHYLPSYSPDLNPDEYLNCDLKNELSKRPDNRVPGKLRQSAESHMRKLAKSPKRVSSYFNAEKIRYAA